MPKTKPLIYTPEAEGKELVKRIKVRLAELDMRPVDLAPKLGVTTQCVYWWLGHPTSLKYGTLCTIAHMLKISVSELIKRC